MWCTTECLTGQLLKEACVTDGNSANKNSGLHYSKAMCEAIGRMIHAYTFNLMMESKRRSTRNPSDIESPHPRWAVVR